MKESSSPTQSESTKGLEQLDRTMKELEQLTKEYNDFRATIKRLFAGEDGKKFLEKIWHNAIVGKLAKVSYDDDLNPIGDMKGSFYAKFLMGRLKLLLGNEPKIYLNGYRNYVDVDPDETVEGTYQLRPKKIQGRTILSVDKSGVVTEPPDYWKYRSAMFEYEKDLAKRAKEKRLLSRLKNKLTKKGEFAWPLVEPVKPENVVIPHEELIAMLQTMKKYLQKTIATLEEAKSINS